MVLARGTLFLNSVDFVRETYGDAAHARVLATLSPEHAYPCSVGAREGSWHPVAALVAYMESAQRLLASDDREFFHRMGADGARRDRERRGVATMLGDVDTAVRLARVLWRTYFQGGALDVLETDGHGVTLRIRDFPARRALCRRMVGSIEVLLGPAADGVRAVERACSAMGAPCCEIRVSWDAPRPAPAHEPGT